jgi:DNA processing protein
MMHTSNWNIEEILTLSLSKSVNSRQLYNYVENYDSFDRFRRVWKSRAQNQLNSQQSFFASEIDLLMDEAKKQVDLCNKNGVEIISIWDERYPKYLKEIDLPPNVLFVKGNLQWPDTLCMSIVGTRRCTNYGRLNAERFSQYFSQKGIVVVSGLAQGIDTYSHMATVDTGGITYAVIASGIDKISPSYSQKNSEKIIESGGAIISEYMCGTLARPGYFPQRNRIISGLSKAIVVVESKERGGSLITARFAFDQGREVFSIPGNINSERSRGTNNLIKKQMAHLAGSPEEVLEELGIIENSLFEKETKVKIKLDPEEEKIVNCIDFEPIQIDELSNKCNIEITQLLVKLLNLEFKGLVKQLPGKHFIKAV